MSSTDAQIAAAADALLRHDPITMGSLSGEELRSLARAALEAGEAAGSEWLPMAAFSGSDQPVQRWHKIHKAPITVRYVGSNGIVASNGEVLPWLEASSAHAWPDDAFTEHFRLLPPPPTEGDL